MNPMAYTGDRSSTMRDEPPGVGIQDRGRHDPSVPEFHLLRSVACLGVVAIHALSIGLQNPHGALPGVITALQAAQMLLMFSTPTFVFLSAVILGYRYNGPPTGFLQKRGRFVVVPFVTMSISFALYYSLKSLWRNGEFELFIIEVLRGSLHNLLGGNHLWFIIPIVQFYALYAVFGHRLRSIPPRLALGGAFLLNVAYLALFNFAPPFDNAYSRIVGQHWYSFLFPAWAFYFVAGLYAGASYRSVHSFLRRRIRGILLALIACASVMLYLHFSGLLHDVSSRRVDVLVYTFCVIATILFAAAQLARVPPLLLRISRYAFGIYILHPLALNFVWPLLVPFSHVPLPILVCALWVGGVCIAALAVKLLASLPFGSIFIGHVRKEDTARRIGEAGALPSLARQRVS